MIDTHAHLDFPEYDGDREEVISRFFGEGPADAKALAGKGEAIINIGVDLERSRKSIEIAQAHENIFASVGIHPDFFSQGSTFPFPDSSSGNSSKSNLFGELRKLAKYKKVVAIGETGLDYYHIKKPDFSRGNPVSVAEAKERQKKGFLAQIEIAKELGLPVVVHCREVHPVASGKTPERFGAWEDLYEIISGFIQGSVKSKLGFSLAANKSPQFLKAKLYDSPELSFTNFVLHCYSGEKKDTEKFLKLPNVYFSFSGNITYPKPKERAEKLAEAVQMIPLDKIMLDSDSPFLTPQEKRGQKNEPINVIYIAKKIAEIKNIGLEEVKKETSRNARSFFQLQRKRS